MQLHPGYTDSNKEINIAIMMADLSGYTAMTEVHGATSAITIIEKYTELVKKSLVGSSFLHERVGDEMVIVADKAEDLAYTAIFLFEKAYQENSFLPLHAGMHYGPVIKKDGAYFGSTINTTSRITATAEKGRVVCSAEFWNQLPPEHQFIKSNKGIRLFKNMLHPVELFEISCCIESLTKKYVIDPVCHMLIKNPGSSPQLQHNDETLYFCSDKCLEIFKSIQNL